MNAKSIPPVNKRLCRAAAALAGVTAIAFIAGNAAMWLVPEWNETVARNVSTCKPSKSSSRRSCGRSVSV